MAISLGITGINSSNGRLLVSFSNNRHREFADAAAAREFVRNTLGEEAAEAMLIAVAFALPNPATIIGKTLTVDPTAAANIVRIA